MKKCTFLSATGLIMSDEGFNLLKQLEGLQLAPYSDGSGTSIGYGHQIQPGQEWMLDGITQAEADEIFADDVSYFEQVVNDYFYDADGNATGAGLDADMFDALVMFAFNIGGSNFAGSQLARMVNAGASNADIYNFWLSTWVGSPAVPGLVNRRQIEADYAFAQGEPATAKKRNYAWVLLPLALLFNSNN